MAGINYVGPYPSTDESIVDKQYVDVGVATKYTLPDAGIPEDDLSAPIVNQLADIVNKVDASDPRLTDTRVPKAHAHTGDEVTVTDNAGAGVVTQSISLWLNDLISLIGLKANAQHTHFIENVTGLQAALNSKGTSDLVIGTTAGTALAGNTDLLKIGTTSTTAKAGNYAPPVATTTVTGAIKLAGDLGGTSALPTVPGLAGKANTAHTHTIANVTGLQTKLDSLVTVPNNLMVSIPSDSNRPTEPAVGTAVWVGNSPPADPSKYDMWLDDTEVGPGTGGPGGGVEDTIAWTKITGKPTVFTPTAHTHTIANVTGLQDVLNLKGTSNLELGTTGATAKAGNWFPTMTNVIGLNAELADKATSVHEHAIADITGLEVALNSKGTSNLVIGTSAATAKAGNYQPAWTDVTSKPTTFAPIIGTTSTTAMAGNKPLFSGAYSALTGTPSSFTPATHTHAIADVTGLQTALNGKGVSNLTIGTTSSTAARGDIITPVASLPGSGIVGLLYVIPE